MKIFSTSLNNIARSNYLFLSFKFHEIANYLEDNSSLLQNRVGDYFDIISGYAFKSDDYDSEGIKLVRIGDITKNGQIEVEETVRLPEDFEKRFEKYLLKQNDVLIAMTGATIGKTGFLGELSEKLLLNQRVGVLRNKSEFVNTKFFYYLTKSDLFQKQIKINSMGKSQDNVSPFDILNIKIPNVEKYIQDEAIEKIKLIEREIENLQAQVGALTEPINRVFAREFGFDIEKFEELKKQKIFSLTLEDFSANQDLRFSAKFHRPAAKFVESELRKITNKSIKDFLAEDIVLGASVSPDDYDDNGEFYYVAMSSIKSWSFDKDNSRLVSDAYSERNKAKSINESDIVVARSGEGTIGKVALIEDDVKGICADFTMRIRLKNYNAKFAYYYFRTEYFQYLIETHKKGLGNNTNIFPSQIKQFPLPDISPEKQIEILDEINEEFAAQNQIKLQIEGKRKEIDDIIEQVLK